MFYSAEKNGFYTPEIHGAGMPSDVVEIGYSDWLLLLQGQAEGKKIISDQNGRPFLAEQSDTPFVPSRVPMRKARRMLRSVGLLEGIEAALNSIPGEAGENARDDWEYSSEIDRSNPTFQLLVQGLGLTQQQIDDLMIAADALP